jgi:hypothetical protein
MWVKCQPLHTSGNRSSDRNKHYKRSENKLIVCYVDIGGIVDHHCLDFLYCNVVDHHWLDFLYCNVVDHHWLDFIYCN